MGEEKEHKIIITKESAILNTIMIIGFLLLWYLFGMIIAILFVVIYLLLISLIAFVCYLIWKKEDTNESY